MKPFYFCFLTLLVFSHFVSAQTNISGGIYNDVTWTKANSPYIISGDVVLFDGATLTINPGTVVKFNLDAKIILRGKINAVGTINDSITFTSNQTTPASPDYWGLATDVSAPASWQGAGKITMEYIIVEYAKEFFDFGKAAYNGPYSIKNSRFTNNEYILKDLSASAASINITFDNCLFTNNYFGVSGGGEDHHVYIQNCWFVNNEQGSAGGYVSNCVYTGNTKVGAFLYHEIRNSYFFNNYTGAQVDMHHDTKFTNNQVYNNAIGVVITRMFVPTPTVEFKKNIICNNSAWNIRYDYTYNIDLTNNCWCSNDSSFIASKIRDGYDDVSYGIAKFDYNQNCTTSFPPPAGTTPIVAVAPQMQFKVHPNPASQYLTITPADTIPYNITINTIDGRRILFFPEQSGIVTIQVSDIPSGIYFIAVSDKNTTYPLKKILIQ